MNQTDRPATTWAWTQIESPNLDFQGTALTFLGLAELADRALNSPDGYTTTSHHEIADLTHQDQADVFRHLADLVEAGLVVLSGRLGWRVPEEAFNPPDRECSQCIERATFEATFKTTPDDREGLCGRHAASAVSRDLIASLVPIEAVWAGEVHA